MSKGRLLLVDDEPQLIRALRPALLAEGYDVDVAVTGGEAISQLGGDQFDLVILDLGLPDLDGKTVIETVRRFSAVPIVVLSARGVEQERIEALDLGADDFVGKPFPVGELMARVRAALRGRRVRTVEGGAVDLGALSIDFQGRSVKLRGSDIRLTQREFDFLEALARQKGRVVTHRQIISAVWGASSSADNQSVRVLAAQVRQKLEEDPSDPEIILTEAGLGYRLALD
jgi:two-component system, OmpR family, KDP operon response regulator KdpE